MSLTSSLFSVGELELAVLTGSLSSDAELLDVNLHIAVGIRTANCRKYRGLMLFATTAILETGASVITGVDWSNNTEPNPLSDKRKMADCLADFESV